MIHVTTLVAEWLRFVAHSPVYEIRLNAENAMYALTTAGSSQGGVARPIFLISII